MAKSPKRPAAQQPKGWIAANGVDLIAGPTIRTTPVCPPSMLPKIPQLGLNMGMDRRP